MRIIRQSWSFEDTFDSIDFLDKIERAARTCYKTRTTGNDEFIRNLIRSGHHSTLEHANLTVRIITDRGVTHEIVRHRIASYSQESTRYCNYSQLKFGREITVILPVWFEGESHFESYSTKGISHEHYIEAKETAFGSWKLLCMLAEVHYFDLLDKGQTPQQARTVLPNSLKTEIVMTCNVREWRHFFTLRASKAAHPQMRDLAISMLRGFQESIPVLFEDLTVE